MTDLPANPEGRTYGVPRRREQVIALLTEAFARNDLEQSELERRLALAEQARTIEELDGLVADFPSEALAAAPAAAVEPAAGAVLSPEEVEREVARLDGQSAPTQLNVLGDQTISPTVQGPRVLRSVSVLGDVTVDLRRLAGERGIFLVKLVALLGDTKLLVSRGTEVQTRHVTLLGDQKRRRRGAGLIGRLARTLGAEPEQAAPALAAGPVVVVTGVKLLGDTVVIED